MNCTAVQLLKWPNCSSQQHMDKNLTFLSTKTYFPQFAKTKGFSPSYNYSSTTGLMLSYLKLNTSFGTVPSKR